ncbi:hypothetical protein Moror_6753 [Moniliophthora roreri MCA 2997]|uniref:BSD domain-containing protein n=1 Tax=Moniliophthora roreri (strain MCA 2997) TaxID=1381753 RepID=V2XVX8_MONRO|nr:hypothetical protein Moror_6753 [Moniliophthora roreri MCA 2997]
MNFLDPYDINASATSNTPTSNDQNQSLNDEVTQVMSSLNRFWGGFRQQSQSVLQTARKDFSDVVVQAQKEFSRLTAEGPKESEDQPTASTSSAASSADDVQPRASVETVKPGSSSTLTEEPANASTNAYSVQNLFSRLQSALPPNVVSAVQENIPQSVKHLSENTDFAQLRTTLTTEFTRLQGVTRAQAEEYVQKSEALLREAVKEAGEVFKDAVKVIPPDQVGAGGPGSGFIWDGTDMWMLPSEDAETNASTDKGKEKITSTAVATRAEALVKRLKGDPNILRHDPESEQGVRETYLKWVEQNSLDKGMDNEEWNSKINSHLDQTEDGRALQKTLDTLVPAEIPRNVFWKRYFFRVHQIREEEEKRKALIQGTIESEDDFSWEDDDAEEVPSTNQKGKTPTSEATKGQNAVPATHSAKGSTPESTSVTPTSPQAHTPANTSPRESSEESYDLVSSGNVSGSGEGKGPAKQTAPGDAAEDDDSDWE